MKTKSVPRKKRSLNNSLLNDKFCKIDSSLLNALGFHLARKAKQKETGIVAFRSVKRSLVFNYIVSVFGSGL